MSLPTSMLRVLLAKGIDADTILAVAEAAEAEQAAADEARREKRRESNRARQRAWYNRHVRDNAPNNVISCDNQDNAVMQREDGEDRGNKKSPTPPINYPDKLNPTLPSEASPPLASKPRRFDWPEDGFERFWQPYPRKTDRKKAKVAFDRLRRADRVALEIVIAGVHRMVASGLIGDEARFAPHPTTFLNNDRWEDEWPAKAARAQRSAPAGRTADFWASDAADAHHELNGGRYDERPFDIDTGSWHRSGEPGDRRPDEPSSQQAGADPWRLPALRIVGGR